MLNIPYNIVYIMLLFKQREIKTLIKCCQIPKEAVLNPVRLVFGTNDN
jgi:hypothetical protein